MAEMEEDASAMVGPNGRDWAGFDGWSAVADVFERYLPAVQRSGWSAVSLAGVSERYLPAVRRFHSLRTRPVALPRIPAPAFGSPAWPWMAAVAGLARFRSGLRALALT